MYADAKGHELVVQIQKSEAITGSKEDAPE